jgi:hypothetical protein
MRWVGGASRLDWVKVATGRGPVAIPWSMRELLIERLRKVKGSDEVIRAFRAVGATRPVELSDYGKSVLLEVLSALLDQADGDAPAGVAELRSEILDDLDAAGYWRHV